MRVALSAPADWLPPLDLLPLHAPDALQAGALVDDHVSVTLPPDTTVAGLAESETVGAAAKVLAGNSAQLKNMTPVWSTVFNAVDGDNIRLVLIFSAPCGHGRGQMANTAAPFM